MRKRKVIAIDTVGEKVHTLFAMTFVLYFPQEKIHFHKCHKRERLQDVIQTHTTKWQQNDVSTFSPNHLSKKPDSLIPTKRREVTHARAQNGLTDRKANVFCGKGLFTSNVWDFLRVHTREWVKNSLYSRARCGQQDS